MAVNFTCGIRQTSQRIFKSREKNTVAMSESNANLQQRSNSVNHKDKLIRFI